MARWSMDDDDDEIANRMDLFNEWDITYLLVTYLLLTY